jgi:predicted secreted protein
MITLDASDNPRSVALAAGESATVRLPAQAGTGYTWQVISAGEPGYTIEPEPDTQQTDRPGGTVYQAFQITAKSPGSYRIELGYLRPWETASPARTASIALVVSG